MSGWVVIAIFVIGIGGAFAGIAALAGVLMAIYTLAGIIVVTCLLCAPVAMAQWDAERRS